MATRKSTIYRTESEIAQALEDFLDSDLSDSDLDGDDDIEDVDLSIFNNVSRYESQCFQVENEHLIECSSYNNSNNNNNNNESDCIPDRTEVETTESVFETCDEEASKAPEVRRDYRWRKVDWNPPFIGFSYEVDEDEIVDTFKAPVDYFKTYFPPELIDIIIESTARYYLRNTGNVIRTDVAEIYKLIAVHILIGTLKFPKLELYWKKGTAIPLISSAMTRSRFHFLRNNLHFAVDPVADDNLWRVRPLLDTFTRQAASIPYHEFLCIDEQMVPFKGRTKMKQYMPKKPNKWGIKLFLLCSSDGIVHDLEIYQGKNTNSGKYGLGFCSDIVLRLSESIPSEAGFKLFFDNYFTTLPLLIKLKSRGIYATGTLRSNRTHRANNHLCNEKELKKRGRGSLDDVVDVNNGLCVIRWLDSGMVQLASSIYGKDPLSKVKRFCGEEKKFIDIDRPHIVEVYNNHMGGIDKTDFLIALYRIDVKTRKWTLKIFDHFIDMSVTNCWLEYKRQMTKLKQSPMSLLDFRLQLAEELLFSNVTPGRKRGRPTENQEMGGQPKKLFKSETETRPASGVRYDQYNHWPQYCETRKNCKLEGCKGISRMMCGKCNVHLCAPTKDKNCFVDFHVKTK